MSMYKKGTLPIKQYHFSRTIFWLTLCSGGFFLLSLKYTLLPLDPQKEMWDKIWNLSYFDLISCYIMWHPIIFKTNIYILGWLSSNKELIGWLIVDLRYQMFKLRLRERWMEFSLTYVLVCWRCHERPIKIFL